VKNADAEWFDLMPPTPTISLSVNSNAAQYVRMSTEHQQYSPQNQSDTITKFATQHSMEIVKTYDDHGRSGLNLAGRDGLRQLLSDVESGQARFTDLLVYDVSRWGRFQDADESAYYEYVLKRAGIRVHYCGEQFANDGSMASALMKTLKRTMAGEYSRELSVKVFAGQCRLIELGFRQGGPAGYGLRRQLVDRDGKEKTSISKGRTKEPTNGPSGPCTWSGIRDSCGTQPFLGVCKQQPVGEGSSFISQQKGNLIRHGQAMDSGDDPSDSN